MEAVPAGDWKLIFGLGNPGWRYRNTRHNAGFLAVREFARRHRWKLKQRDHLCRFAAGRMGNDSVVLALPQTFMNQSGKAVAALRAGFPTPAEGILVVVDDFHLPLGSMRIRKEGSAGGHHGLESIEAEIGREFGRMRLGIGPKIGNDVIAFVLGRWTRAGKKALGPMIERAADALEFFVSQGIEAAASRYNFTAQ